ncbi:hypothetical protein DYBT9623_01215 [Dyadobacter sp. CECT 9623]|uniref:Uncharacterized protein n=1 Tax=Dyadobacter linearis TaxID=2823330 RepID=A0ABM8ULY1_9BACT|nr:hypothetical protein DYBT9623_01215 [Dyadobacter sp. CECT 9623]
MSQIYNYYFNQMLNPRYYIIFSRNSKITKKVESICIT